MSETVYVPARGLNGKIRRLAGRVFARRPMVIRPDRPIVSITFDDFPRSAATTAKDELERRGWRGTYYVSGGYAGTTNHLGRMYEPADLKRLVADGHEIGCHTYGHIDAARRPAPEVEADIRRNADAVAEMADVPRLETFAFPYGEASPRAKRRLIDRFRALRSVRPGINYDGADRAMLKAVGIEGGAKGIAEAVAYAEAVAGTPGWLIFYTHEVTEDPSEWGCTPADLARVLDAVAQSGADVMPVGEALDRLAA